MALFKKGQPRPPGAGRKKGSKNKKTILQEAFEKVLTPEIAKALIGKAIKQATAGELDKPTAHLLLGLLPYCAPSMEKTFSVLGKKAEEEGKAEEEITEFTLKFKT